MTQLSMNKGLLAYKQEGLDAVVKELTQMNARDVFTPVHLKDLRLDDRNKILESHLFLEQKRDKSVKDRLVAGGNKQREYINKYDVGSPTCTTESIMLTAVIDAQEHRDVAIVDIPNAFIQTVVTELIYV